MGAGADDHETPQGTLQLGAEQIPAAGRAYRARAQGAKTLKPGAAREPKEESESTRLREPSHANDPSSLREPSASRGKRRPISIPHDPTESQLHQSIAELLDWILIEPALYTTFPAGWGRLSKGTAGRLFASGLKKGMPDILVFDAPNQVGLTKVIGIELKVGRNSLSSAQRTMFAKLQAAGIEVFVCRSQDDVIAALQKSGILYREVSLRGI